MIKDPDYLSIPHLKNGGPSAKTGFRIEQYWGIKKIYDLYSQQKEDFFVIFDNYCDIEYGFYSEASISFDQVKTEGLGDSFTVSEKALIRVNNLGHSIFSELASFGENNCVSRVGLVWNYPFRPAGKSPEPGSFNFWDLSENEKKDISEAVQKEIKKDVSWAKYSFFFFNIKENTAKNQMIGETANFLTVIGHEETPYPKMFLEYLEGAVVECSCNSVSKKGIVDTIKKKGINRSFVDSLLQTYQNTINSKKKSVYQYFEENSSQLSPKRIGRVKESLVLASTEINKNGSFYRVFVKIRGCLMGDDQKYNKPAYDLFAQAPLLFEPLKEKDINDDDLTALTVLACKEIEEGKCI